MGERPAPRCTYRVQLHEGFGFEAAGELAPYLARLGASHVYCSPYLQAVSGSTHGYDVVDHSRLNRDLGGDDGHQVMSAAFAEAALGQLLDIVPNHMATDGRDNRWWWDVLENGPSSRYASYFDIDWEGSEARDFQRVLVPVLGDHYGRVLEAGELSLERKGGSFLVRYHDHELPISPRSLDTLLAAAADKTASEELAEVAACHGRLPHSRLSDSAAVSERHREKELCAERLAFLCAEQPEVATAVDEEARRVAADPDAFDALLSRQNYRLAFWRVANEELDYRRFFNIETLVALRVEDDAVFADAHGLVISLVEKGVVDGLRVDHVDGLRDPEGYLQRLRRATGSTYTVVEKILTPGESLPTWPVAGTSGYDFIARVSNLFIDSSNEEELTSIYHRFSGESASYEEVARASKQQVIGDELRSEVDRLTSQLLEVCDRHRRHRDRTRSELAEAIGELLASFPVYRTYVAPDRAVSASDEQTVRSAVGALRRGRPDLDSELSEFIGDLLTLRHPGETETAFALGFQQLSGPVMAKGVEDTAFYRYHRLVSLNEVGGAPEVFGRPVSAFHEDTAASAERWPQSMLTLSTHDTKRSGDVRARLHLLSEMPEAWQSTVADLADAASRHKRSGLPDANAEYLLYQTLVGAWPLETDRAAAFMEKATREAKVHTSWLSPNACYEDALRSFVYEVLRDESVLAVLERFLTEQRLVEWGRVNSLAQTTLLLTCPGVPDIYQGSEVWDLSLVDPDNRRPVDYPLRRRLLEESEELPAPSIAADHGGLSKMWLIARLLAHRREHPEIYASPSYEPLLLSGSKSAHAVCFVRDRLLVLVPRLVAGLRHSWGDTVLTLPGGSWRSLLDGGCHDGRAAISDLLATFPVAVLAGEGS
jgi:(1->4)-alpha-D-glucan 1-alpha-D-glucosylmutase